MGSGQESYSVQWRASRAREELLVRFLLLLSSRSCSRQRWYAESRCYIDTNSLSTLDRLPSFPSA